MPILKSDPTASCQIEILSPEREDVDENAKTCLCCARRRPASFMEDDGCGICEECLLP